MEHMDNLGKRVEKNRLVNEKFIENYLGIDRKKEILEDLERKTIHQFNISFVLMSLIPMLLFAYILCVKLFSIDIMVGDVGGFLLLALLFCILGLIWTRMKLKEMIQIIMYYNKMLLEKEMKIYELQQEGKKENSAQ